MSREDAKREERATFVVAVRPFGDADESLIAGRQKYRLDNLEHISVRLKVEHSVFGTINKQRFGSKFFEELANPYESELRWLTQSCFLNILLKRTLFFPKPQ